MRDIVRNIWKRKWSNFLLFLQLFIALMFMTDAYVLYQGVFQYFSVVRKDIQADVGKTLNIKVDAQDMEAGLSSFEKNLLASGKVDKLGGFKSHLFESPSLSGEELDSIMLSDNLEWLKEIPVVSGKKVSQVKFDQDKKGSKNDPLSIWISQDLCKKHHLKLGQIITDIDDKCYILQGMTDSQGLWFDDNLVSQSYVSLKNTVVVESGVKSNTLQDLYASIPEGVTEKEAIKAVETAGDLCKVDVSAKTVDTVLKAAYDEAMEDNFIWLSGAVLIISVVMIATITLMSARIYERKKEIGIRRAVGYTSGRLAVLFTQELFFVGVLAWLTEGIYAWYVYGQSQDGSVEFSQGQFGLPLFLVSGLFVVIQIIPACIFAMRQMGKMQPQKLIGGSE